MKTFIRHIDYIKTDVEFVVGGNAQENHDIIDAADPIDLWFHIAGESSCHVIAKVAKVANIILDKKALQKIAKQGAVICKESSNYKKQKNVEIDYTRIEYVTKLETPGKVQITNVKKMII